MLEDEDLAAQKQPRKVKDLAPLSIAELEDYIAAMEQEAHVLVARMPRSDTVGPRLTIWESNRLVVIVGGVGKVAGALTPTSHPADDVHHLIVLARLRGPRHGPGDRPGVGRACKLCA